MTLAEALEWEQNWREVSVLEPPGDSESLKVVAAEVKRLRSAIRKTLDENAHLAYGENCTLLALKVALRESGVPWELTE